MKSNGHRKLLFQALAIICACLMLVLSSGCGHSKKTDGTSDGGSSKDTAPVTFKDVTLPYSQKDVLNPYIAETKQNQELSKLLFDPLFVLDRDFTVSKRIADSYEAKDSRCIVKLKSITFTDGTALTADDVAYSFRKAKDGAVYSSQLKDISCSVSDQSTVIFTRSNSDPYFINLLDFPIIKSGTSELKDENNCIIPPVGCGRYILSDDKRSLTANDSYYAGKIKLRKIQLVDCPDDSSMEKYISSGKISVVHSDMSDGIVPGKTGNTIHTGSANLVFIGVNCNYGITSDVRVRLAISCAIDREQICKSAFYGYADEATGIFPSYWKEMNGYEALNKTQNLKQMVAYLEDIGYNSKDASGYYTNGSGEKLKLRILCCSDSSIKETCARTVSSQLAKCGIETEVVSLGWSEYLSELTYGHFDLYIGEIKFSKSLYVNGAFSPSVIYGFPENSDSVAKFGEYYSGTSDIMVAVSSFASELPFIPVCYKNGVTVCTESLEDYLTFSYSDIYCGIENYGK